MPVLCFPCAVHRLARNSRPTRRRVWIKGHDFRTLALAATAQLGAAEDQCEYGIARPDMTKASVLLEVAHPDGDALVGPMTGPLPPPTMSLGEHFSLDGLLAELGFATRDGCWARLGSSRPGQYEVVVTYSPIWKRHPFPPEREGDETDAQYRARYEAGEVMQIERVRYQGIHLIRYEVPPRDWTDRDLEMLMVLAYRFLPTDEPRWRESGAITQGRFAAPRDEGRRVTVAPCLQVGRGDYVAHLRLPAFPARALADWLASRHYDINLRHPVIKLELVARGWRCAGVTSGSLQASEARRALADAGASSLAEMGGSANA